jgi:hypothetical protein
MAAHALLVAVHSASERCRHAGNHPIPTLVTAQGAGCPRPQRERGRGDMRWLARRGSGGLALGRQSGASTEPESTVGLRGISPSAQVGAAMAVQVLANPQSQL